MSNYESSPAAIVSQLQQLLRNAYGLDKGHLSILKEIVQNADDAGAQRLHLVLMRRGIECAQNHLLHGPALACINDGSFTGHHDQAIRTMSITSKAQDASKIGRFGLGQKSVFHLSEAYFYLGWSAEEPDTLRANVLDPWAGPNGDPGHPTWNDFVDSDKAAILERIAHWTGPRETGKGGFVLYLPLRREEHRRPHSGGVITQNFPDLGALAIDLTRIVELGHLLPQLNHVSTIETWEVDAIPPQRLASARWTGTAGRLSRPDEQTTFDRGFRGNVEVTQGEAPVATLQFFGHERVVTEPPLAALMANPLWPKRITATPDNDVQYVLEPAVAHGAATVILTDWHAEASSRSLRSAWAVFLPLGGDGDGKSEPRDSRWRLWLHGYFFPDSGRRRVLGIEGPGSPPAPAQEHEVPLCWNVLLRDLATIPCLLPAVWAAVEASEPLLGEELALALAQSDLWQQVQAVATAEMRLAWGPHVPNGSTSVHSRARAVRDNRAMVPVPRPDSEEMKSEDVAEVVRALTSVGGREHVVIVWEKGPLLAAPGALQPWTGRALRRALEDIAPSKLSSEAPVRYLGRWLCPLAPLPAECGRALLALLRKCLIASVSFAGKSLEPWRALAALCPREYVTWSDAPLKLLRELARVESTVVVLPMSLAPNAPGTTLPPFTLIDVRPLLLSLSKVLRASPSDPDAGKLADELVKRVGPRHICEDSTTASLPLLRVWSARAGKHMCVSWSALENRRVPDVILRRQGLSGPEPTASGLFEALNDPEADVMLADDALADAIGAEKFGDEVLARVLGNPRFDLASPDKRHALFLRLVGAKSGAFPVIDHLKVQRGSDLYHALRLLLHGVLAKRQNDADLLVLAASATDAQRRLEEDLLLASGESWRLLPSNLAQRGLETLGVVYVSPQVLAGVLSESIGPWREQIGGRLDTDDRKRLRDLLAGVRALPLFKSLSIHESSRGPVCGDAPGVYLEGEWPLSPRLSTSVTLVKNDADPVMAAFQRQAFRCWSAVEQAKLCLDLPSSSEIALEMLDALPALGGDLVKMEAELRERAWVPTASATRPFVPPRDVVNLKPAVDEAVRRVLGSSSCEYFTPGGLSAEVREHRRFRFFCENLAQKDKDALDAAALQLSDLAQLPAHPLWILPSAPSEGQRSFLEKASRLRALESDRPWALVQALCHDYGDLWFGLAQEIVKLLQKGPTADRLVELTKLLATDVDPGAQSDQRAVVREYLRFAREREDFRAGILPRLSLRDATGAWRPAGELVGWGPDLEPRYRLHPDDANTLRLDELKDASLVKPSEPTRLWDAPDSSDERAAATVLGGYIRTLQGAVSDEALGHFVAMLGDGQGNDLLTLAESLLAGHDAELARIRLCKLSGHAYADEPGKLKRSRWAFRIVDGGAEAVVNSITGVEVRARVALSTANLFVERPPKARGAERARWLQLRRVDPSALSTEELARAFKGAIGAFLECALEMTVPSSELDRLWTDVGRGGRASVEPARRWVFRRLASYITMLVGRRDAQLSGPVLRIERAEHRLTEIEPGETYRLNPENEALSAARRELVALVEQNADVQARLVAAVRRKVEERGYVAAQVLFELFQNADDAATQLVEMRGERRLAGDRSRSFAVKVAPTDAGSTLRVQHWGRGINQMSEIGGRTIERLEERGYELDLQRMLTLHESDKDDNMTGRFGLGFKSVYLLTDAPRIRDSQLSLEIVAGFLPRHLVVNDRTDDRSSDRATTIELPLREAAQRDAALERICAYGGLLVVFAQTVRRIEIDAGAHCAALWRREGISQIAGLEIGELRVGLSVEAPVARVLALRRVVNGPHLVLAFKLGARGLEPFDATVPTIWCTAPTLECWGLGFCVNGAFALDVGRAKLTPAAAANSAVFRQLGDLLHESLRALHAALSDRFEATASALGLEVGARSPDEVRHRFWEGVFDQLTEPLVRDRGTHAYQFACALNAQGGGLSGLLRDLPLLPTHLPEAHARLTRITDVRWILDELIASRSVLACIARLPWGTDKPAPGACISRAVAARLEPIGITWERPPKLLALGDVLKHVWMRGTNISASIAVVLLDLREAVKASGLDQLRILGGIDEMQQHSRDWRFQSRGNSWKDSSTLILGERFSPLVDKFEANRRDQLTDEIMRAAFAPPDAVLHDAYAGDAKALELFLFARKTVVATARQLATWARSAGEESLRVAVVRYLAEGDLANEVRKELAQGPAWCTHEELLRLAGKAGISAEARSILEVTLFHARTTFEPVDEDGPDAEEDDGPLPFGAPRGVLHSRDVLRKIVHWWARVGRDRATAFHREVYPHGENVEQLGARLMGGDRQAWTTLLTLGACQRFGRQTPQQHRGFIELLQARGTPRWWEVIVGQHAADRWSDWMVVLEQWMDDAERPDDDRYNLWFGLFPTLYRIHRYGETYAELLLGAPRRVPGGFHLDRLLEPKTDSELHGTGGRLDVPRLSRVLGIGAPWVLRELVWLGAVVPAKGADLRHLWPFCFVPRRATRQLLVQLGASDLDDASIAGATAAETSRRIHGVLIEKLGLSPDAASFGNSFDLPLYLIATDVGARLEAGVMEDLS
jgi:hypothetical protein